MAIPEHEQRLPAMLQRCISTRPFSNVQYLNAGTEGAALIAAHKSLAGMPQQYHHDYDGTVQLQVRLLCCSATNARAHPKSAGACC